MTANAHPSPPVIPDTRRAYRDLNRALLAILLLSGAVACLRLLAARFTLLPLGACASQRLLGMDCPLCGLTRGLAALLRGDLTQALDWNPLTPTMAALLIMETLVRGVGATDTGARLLAPGRRADLWLHVALGVAYAVYALVFLALQGSHPG